MEDKENKAQERPKAPGRAAMAVSACALAAALGAVGFSCWRTATPAQSAKPAAEQAQQATGGGSVDDAGGKTSAQPAHTHDWTVTYKTVHHDAETHTEHVNATYRARTSYHTVCNDCEQVIDGIADQHIKDSGHSGYSTNVPITDTVMESAAYDKVVTDKDAWDETVPDKMVCATCGETKDAEVAVATEAATDAAATDAGTAA